ncbi:hypothetical protein F4824DRAFT_262015 [Ustulina deusta]|nr:hypothetical protein F4824DRAFT_262015 [Ustulina deusta]
MELASVLLAPIFQRQMCKHGAFYHCGNFQGCCGIDPCAFLNFDNPCEAAQEEGGDGSDDGKTTATEQPTITVSLPDFSTRRLETSTSTTTEDPETSSSSAEPSRPSTTSVEASTTVGSTTLSTSVVSRSGSGSTTGSATRTLPAPVPTASSHGESSSSDALSESAIVGVSIIAAVGAIVLLVVFFWFARRRRLSKRMSSVRGVSPIPPSPSTVFDFGFATGRRANPTGTAFGAQDRGSPPASDIRAPYGHLYPPRDAHLPQQSSAAEIQQPTEPEPMHAELDSAEPQRPDVSIQRSLSALSPDTTPPLPRRPSLPAVRVHPPQLTPGFPGTQMGIQHHDRGGGQNYRGSTNAPRGTPRATLNATDDERRNNQYANSWAYGP